MLLINGIKIVSRWRCLPSWFDKIASHPSLASRVRQPACCNKPLLRVRFTHLIDIGFDNTKDVSTRTLRNGYAKLPTWRRTKVRFQILMTQDELVHYHPQISSSTTAE